MLTITDKRRYNVFIGAKSPIEGMTALKQEHTCGAQSIPHFFCVQSPSSLFRASWVKDTFGYGGPLVPPCHLHLTGPFFMRSDRAQGLYALIQEVNHV